MTDTTTTTLMTADPAVTTADPAAPVTTTTDPAVVAKPEGDNPEGDKPVGAPEQYEDFKMPENVNLDVEAATEFKTLAKELNLTQEAAQKVSDIGAKMIQKYHTTQMEQITAAQQQWTESSKTDKEFGGDNLQANLAIAKKAMTTFGTPELITVLNESGLGNHPEFIRAFYRMGKATSEDTLIPASRKPANAGGDARNMYDKSNHNA